jgi:hypothetical protein
MKMCVRFTRRQVLSAVAVSGLLMPLAGFAQAQTVACKRNADEKAVYIRSLQTDLMVAALTCNDSDPYNQFINQFKPVLMKDSKQLQSFYSKTDGKAGANELNSFVTQLANDESQRSIQTVGYCDSANQLFASVLALQPDQLEDYATTLPIASTAPIRPCLENGAADTADTTPATPSKKKKTKS